MNTIIQLYDLSLKPAITLGWPISYIELVILFFNVLCVYLVGKNKVLNYPVGIIGIIAYGFFCYTLNFYSEYFLQMFFFVFSLVGWYMWSKKDNGTGEVLPVRYLSWFTFSTYCVLWLIATYLLGNNINQIFAMYVTNVLFPLMDFVGIIHADYIHQPASFPHLDAFTVWGQIIATWMMIRRYVQSWICWIVIDVLSVPMFFLKGGFGVSIMFGLFTILATMGLFRWMKLAKNQP